MVAGTTISKENDVNQTTSVRRTKKIRMKHQIICYNDIGEKLFIYLHTVNMHGKDNNIFI